MAKATRRPVRPKEEALRVIPEIPIKVTVEVVIRNEYPTQANLFNRFHAPDAAGGAGCPDNKFAYTFTRQNASVLSLIVEEYEEENPEDSGEFTTCINDPSPQPKIRILGLAKEDNPGGRVALSLKFLDKDLFPEPKEFTRAGNGFLKLHVLTKLPV